MNYTGQSQLQDPTRSILATRRLLALTSRFISQINFEADFRPRTILSSGKSSGIFLGPSVGEFSYGRFLLTTFRLEWSLKKRGLGADQGCSLCNSIDIKESLSHIFRDCAFTT
ncbi:hypothetical protein vseg_005956 [Gypsophila vaccaria]